MATGSSAVLRYFLMLLVTTLLASAAVRAAEADKLFDQSLGDFRVELESAKKSGKRGLMLMFEAEGCPYCLKMRETVLNQPEVQAYFRRHFLVFSIDMLGDVEIQDTAGRSFREKTYAQELRIRGTPTFMFGAGNSGAPYRATGTPFMLRIIVNSFTNAELRVPQVRTLKSSDRTRRVPAYLEL